VDGAVDAEGAHGERTVGNQCVGGKVGTPNPARGPGLAEFSVAADLPGEDDGAAIVDDDELERGRERAGLGGTNQARHLGKQPADDGLIARRFERLVARIADASME